MPPKTLAIYNPVAARGEAGRQLPQVEAALRTAGIEFDLVGTRATVHAVELAQDAAREGYERIITIGGDGLVHEVVNGLMRASNEGETITLGILPLGSGNDFIKSIPPPLKPVADRDDWRAAVPRLAANKTTLMDVGRIVGDVPAPGHPQPHYFDNGMSVGFSAMVAKYTKTVPTFLSGTSMYVAAVLKVLANYQILRLTITVDGGAPVEVHSTMTSLANGRCFGASFWLTPNAQADDGHLDVFTVKALGRGGILAVIPSLMRGTHLNHPAITIQPAARVVLESPDAMVVEADGELPFLEAHRLEVEILPRRLRVVV